MKITDFNLIEIFKKVTSISRPEPKPDLTLFDVIHDSDMVKKLISQGHDVNKANEKGILPIVAALEVYSKFSFMHLLDAGADPKVRMPTGESLLHYSLRENLRDIPWILMHQDIDLNEKNKLGHTPLMVACLNDEFWCIKEMVENGADCLIKTDDGRTALSFAAEAGSARNVKYFLENHSHEITEEEINRALFLSKYNSKHECIALIENYLLLNSINDTQIPSKTEEEEIKMTTSNPKKRNRL